MSWLVRQEVNNDRLSFSRGQALQHVARTFATGGKEMTVRDALNSALDEEMAADPKVFLMGEEVGEYHGAYKISKGLLDKYGPQRVIDTPITEIYIASLWGGIRILPVLAVLSSFESKVKSIVTQSCPDKAEPTYEFVNQVVCTIENTSSNREICNEIKRLCRCESVSAIDKLLKLLHNKHIVLNYDALDILLTTTSKQNNIELSLQIFKDLLISSECLSSRCYCNLAKAFANTDDCELLLKFIREISDGAFHNNVLILNRIIFGFAEARQIKKALLIFEYMKNLKCKPDLITYNTILGILGRAGQLDEMLLEIASMKEANIIPDIVTYNTLLNNLQKFGRLDLCLAYMREMDGKGLMLDLRTYTALIESFGRSGRIYEALKLFDAMKRGNVRPSVYIYWSLINNLKKMGKLETATLLLNEMNCSLPNLIGPKNFKRKNRE